MTEGFTEYLTLLSFEKENYETFSTYGRQINSVNHLSMIVGLETMKKAYFSNRNGIQDIEKALQEIDGKQSHNDLFLDIESDYKFNSGEELFEPTTLTNIRIPDIDTEYDITQSEEQKSNEDDLNKGGL